MLELSVIIPTYNRALRLVNNLKSLQTQTMPHADFEAIVIDDGSTDETRRIVEEARRTYDYPLRYIYLPRPGYCNPALAWNVGIRASTAETIVHMGADVIAAHDALALLAAYQADCSDGLAYVFGRCYRVHSPMAQALLDYVPWTQDIHVLETLFVEAFHHSAYWHVPVLAAVRKKPLIELQGYDESYTDPWPEDDDMWVRLEASGIYAINVPDVWGAHQYHSQHDPVCGPECPCPLAQKSQTWPGAQLRYHGKPQDLVRNVDGWGVGPEGSYEA
jgi:glycosyltransferase involved in cell wall biosynthesis